MYRSIPILLSLAQLACQSPPPEEAAPATPPPRQIVGACEGLAYVFFVIAENRDRGQTREAQIRMVREGVDNPFSEDPDQALADLLRVIDAVYSRPGQSASDLEASVIDDCVVDDRGQAVLLWPTP